MTRPSKRQIEPSPGPTTQSGGARTTDDSRPVLTETVRHLIEADGRVSGEVLSERFGVSRAALQKWIVKLRDEGFSIDAKPRRGYKLISMPDALLAETVGAHLKTKWLARRIVAQWSVGSTNDELIRAASRGAAHGTCAMAETQTGGRGRRRRAWHSPPRKNIYLSALLRPPIPPHRASILTLASAVAVAEAVEEVAGCETKLKWPNDLMFEGRKLCGILTEISGDPDRVAWIVVGVGINVNCDAFPAELKEIATSLKLATGKSVDRVRLAARVCDRLEHWHDRYLAEGSEVVLSAWKDRPNILGEQVRVTPPGPSEEISGEASDLDSDGALLLQNGRGVRKRIISGDLIQRVDG